MRHPFLQKATCFLTHYSFFVLAGALLIFESIDIPKQNWTGDFWEHAAVVKALTEDLSHPSHPIIRSDIPHAFFSPYAVMVAAFARIAHLNAIEALGYAAFFNLVFFLFSFYQFCVALFGKKSNLVATLGLVLVLFFWGKSPFGWSGFYHLMVLHHVLPYPSTFAMAITFLILSLIAKEPHPQYYNRKTVWIILLSAIVFLSHPNTATILFIAIPAMNFCFSAYSIRYAVLKSVILILPAVALSLLWPYFNVAGLFLGNNYDFQLASKRLYQGGISKNWPFLLLLPALGAVKKDKVIYFFLLSIAMMAGLFCLGYLLKMYGLSRLIAGIMLFAQVLMAYIAIICLSGKITPRSAAYLYLLTAALLVSLYLNHAVIGRSFHLTRGHVYKDYDFLRQLVGTNDIVLSDRGSNSGIPTFSGKVIASDKPVYWVNDITERRRAVDSFFTTAASDSLRKMIIQQYQPDYILIDYARARLEPATLQWIRNLGAVVYRQHEQELIKVKK